MKGAIVSEKKSVFRTVTHTQVLNLALRGQPGIQFTLVVSIHYPQGIM